MKKIFSIPLVGAMLVCISAAGLPQGKVRVFSKPESPYKIDLRVEKPDEVVLKFVEGSGVRLRHGRFVSLAGKDVSRVNRVVFEEYKVKCGRYFTRSEEDLDEERAYILSRLGPDDEIPAELNLYYLVRTSGVSQSEEVIDALNGLDIVEFAYAEVSDDAYVPCGDIPPPTPDFVSRQTYFGPAPAGVNYRYAYVMPGGRCPTQTIAHIEGSWRMGHEDLAMMNPSAYVYGPPTSRYSSWMEHGTACVGIMAADRNGYGVNGFASSRKKLLLACIGYGVAKQINNCAALCGPGDTFSSSFAYLFYKNGKAYHAPLTYVRANYDAVKNATAKGITYTFGAGNTNKDLMDPAYGGRFDPSKYDSGGVIVGASKKNGVDKISFSNYGKPVHCHAWGESITTLGYGNLFNGGGDKRQYYTYRFGGTSGAGPIVAGVAAAFWGVVKEQNGVTLTSRQVRDALIKYGTPQRYGNPIGPQPDLKKMLKAYGLPDGLWLRNDVTTGSNMILDVWGKANGTYIILVSLKRGRFSLPQIPNRDILLDINSIYPAAVGIFNSSGKATVTFPVPNKPNFKHMVGYFQSIDFKGASNLHASNSIEVYIAK